ncbi:MAG: hypothetical protein K2N57_01905 [Clostridia bacterium]|nr:hypothetical protein [Clostridia bacterium]
MATETETRFIKTLAHIACGLREKIQVKENDNYPRSLILRQGINMFAFLMVSKSGFSDDELKMKLNLLNETDFILNYLQYPIANWFSEWDGKSIQEIFNNPLYKMNALVEVDDKAKTFVLTEDCQDFLSGIEQDLLAIDEHIVYDKLKNLSQNDYVTMRKFLIENPLLSNEMRQDLLLKYDNDSIIAEIIDSAYEIIPSEVFLCPKCGWTASQIGEEMSCSQRSCKDIKYNKNSQRKKIDSKFTHRLRLGVMRYICNPGKLELEIAKICKAKDLEVFLWPEKDKYDIKIHFKDHTWGIDAKVYSNAYVLANAIRNDIDFQKANIDKGFYVIPDELAKWDYLKICNKALEGKDFTCVTLKGLKRLINKEIKDERD